MSTENVIFTLAGFAFGVLLGLAINVRWIDDGDTRKVNLSFSSRFQRYGYYAIGVLAVVSVALTAVKNNNDERQTRELAAVTAAQSETVARQTFCNQELIRVISANAQTNAQVRRYQEALLKGIGNVVLNPPPDSAARDAQIRELFADYSLAEAEAQQQREPYPANCGN